MADTKERRQAPRQSPSAAPKPESKAGAPRRPTGEQRGAPMASNIRGELSPEETRRLIAEAAYYRAKERGFEPGHELEDWVEAESEVMGRINGPAQ
jgi:hypothetical protein